MAEPIKIMENVLYVTNSANCMLVVDKNGSLWSSGYDQSMYGKVDDETQYYKLRKIMDDVKIN